MMMHGTFQRWSFIFVLLSAVLVQFNSSYDGLRIRRGKPSDGKNLVYGIKHLFVNKFGVLTVGGF